MSHWDKLLVLASSLPSKMYIASKLSIPGLSRNLSFQSNTSAGHIDLTDIKELSASLRFSSALSKQTQYFFSPDKSYAFLLCRCQLNSEHCVMKPVEKGMFELSCRSVLCEMTVCLDPASLLCHKAAGNLFEA